MELKAYANSQGVRIIGDIPIFVAYDSADAWAHPELFYLNKDGSPSVVAGVPPESPMMSGVRTQYLESSNVNMAQEMSRLLLSQRGYQVSSRLVTTADEMLQEVSNMKR